MEHLLSRVEHFAIIAPYTLRIRFDDSTEQVVDFLPVLRGEIYRPLRDLALFNAVAIDPEFILWSGPMGRILIPRRFTNGRAAHLLLQRWRAPGIPECTPRAEIV